MASSDELGDHDHDEDSIRRVSITETVRVSSALDSHQPPKVVNLSNLDRQCPLLMYLVFFYKHPFSSSADDHSPLWSLDSVFESLKSGLEKTLSIWYPAAGRLIMTSPTDDDVNLKSNGVELGGLNLLCNNSGVVLAKASTAVQISELGDLSQYNDFFENLVYKPPLPLFDDQGGDHFSQMPLVAAQVTKFGCGGYSIGIGISHSVFDGLSAYEFMCAWASSSDIKPNPNKLDVITMDEELRPKPVSLVHDRDALLKMDPCHDDDVDDEGVRRRASAIDHLYQLIMQSVAATVASTDLLMFKSSNDGSSYVHKTFHLSSAFLKCLKKQVVGDSYSCSSFELVAAHLWKAKTLAMGLSKEAMVCLQFAVDARNKVEPPLPQGFTGNAYVLASVAMTASQVVDQSDHKAIVDRIREAKKSVTNKYVKSYMEGVAAGGSQQQTSLPPLKELTLVSDWTRMPFHKVGFLQEQADYASPLVAPVPEVIYFMQNPKDDKGIDMRIGLLPQYLDVFTRYFFTNTK